MTQEQIAEHALIHSSLAILMHEMTKLEPRFAFDYERASEMHRRWSTFYFTATPTPAILTDDQPKEGSTEGDRSPEGEVPPQRNPEGEEGSEAEDEVTG